MADRIKYPIALNPDYTCQGIDARGTSVVFDDLLHEGDKVEVRGTPDGVVVEREGELIVVADIDPHPLLATQPPGGQPHE